MIHPDILELIGNRTTAEILEDKNLTNVAKVYFIATLLQAEGHIHSDLWYAILELKNEYIDQFMVKIPYLDNYEPSKAYRSVYGKNVLLNSEPTKDAKDSL